MKSIDHPPEDAGAHLRHPRQVGDRNHRHPARPRCATSLTDGAAQTIHSIDSRLTHLTTSLTEGTVQAVQAVDQRITAVNDSITGRSDASDRHHQRAQRAPDRHDLGPVPGHPPGHREPRRPDRQRYRHPRRAVRRPARFARRGRRRPHRKLGPRGQRRFDGARGTVVVRHQLACRGRRALAHQPRGQYQRDHPDRRTHRPAGAAQRLHRCRRPVEADLDGSRGYADRRRHRRRQLDPDLGPRCAVDAGHRFLRKPPSQIKALCRRRRAHALRRRQRYRRIRCWPVHAKRRPRWSAPRPTAADQVKSLTADVQRTLSMAGTATAEAITAGAREAQSTLVTASTDAATQVKSLSADMQRSLSMAGTVDG